MSLGGELRYQRWLSTPKMVAADVTGATRLETTNGEITTRNLGGTLRATTTSIGKGTQEILDIPQSVTVQTERLMDDRNLDDFREVLKNTAGVTFQAGETGEEDVRLRGFSLGQAGDIYTDGLRDGGGRCPPDSGWVPAWASWSSPPDWWNP